MIITAQFYGYFAENLIFHTILLLSEFCDGGSLSNLILATNGLDEMYISAICYQIVEALHYLHTKQIAVQMLKVFFF